MNEEEIKIKVVLPFLSSLGFVESDLVFEKSFSIKAGRSTFKIDNTKNVDTINPRLDILVKGKTHGSNLFVLEIKADNIQITNEDIDQAISYSRLVHPIAPISIITNGETIRIFDTISKKELNTDSDKIKAKCEGNEIKLDIDTYYEALSNFLSYSENNLTNFLRQEYFLNTKNIRGSIEEKNKIYIDDVYASPQKLNKIFDDFLSQGKKVFGLVGMSGMGKTCWMCNTAAKLIEKSIPVFYYNFNLIKNGIFTDIANDLNWSENISPILNEYEAIKRLLKIFKKATVFIFLDGLDERRQGNDIVIMEEFIKQIQSRDIKVVVTCKTYDWEKFIKNNRAVTKFSDELFCDKDDEEGREKYKGIVISELEDDQLRVMINKYKKFYNYYGRIQSSLYDEFKRNPFLLRIAFEYASKKNIKFLNLSIKELYEHYLGELLSPLTNKAVSKIFLIEIAKLFYENNTPYIGLSQAIKATNIDLGLLNEYLRWNILNKREINGEEIIEFYFTKLRDYLIAYKASIFDKYNLEQIESFLKAKPTDVKLESFNFYYSLAESSQKRLIDSTVYNKAKYFLEEREKIIEQYFYEFRSIFHPHTIGEVGIYCDVDLTNNRVFSFGLRAIKKDETKIILNPTFRESDLRDTFMDYSISQLSITTNLPNRTDVIKGMLFKELQDNIKGYGYSEVPFNFRNNIYITSERILEYVEKYYSKEYQLDGKNHTIYEKLPLKLTDLKNKIIYTHIIDVLSFKVSKLSLEYHWEPKRYEYSNLTSKENISVQKETTQIIGNKNLLGQYLANYPLSSFDSILINDVENLLNYNITSIQDTIIPSHISKKNFSFDNVDPETTKNIIKGIAKKFFDEYQGFAITNFPNLYKDLPLASKLPLNINIYFDSEEPEPHHATIILFQGSANGGSVECIDRKRQKSTPSDNDKLYKKLKSQYNVVYFTTYHLMKSYFDRNNPNSFVVSNKKRRWDIDILRRFIFDLLKKDIENYLKKEEYKLLSNIDINAKISPNAYDLFNQVCDIAIGNNIIRIGIEEFKGGLSENYSVVIGYLAELEEKHFIKNFHFTIGKKSFWFELNYFALYQYCKIHIAEFQEIEEKVEGFLIKDKNEVKSSNSQELSDKLNVEHQVLRSILFELEKQKIIKLQNVLSGISWIYKRE